MRIKELTVEGFMDGFRKGYGKSLRPEKKAEPVSSSANSSPFSILSKNDAKEILRLVLSGEKLNNYQLSQIQKVYNKL